MTQWVIDEIINLFLDGILDNYITIRGDHDTDREQNINAFLELLKIYCHSQVHHKKKCFRENCDFYFLCKWEKELVKICFDIIWKWHMCLFGKMKEPLSKCISFNNLHHFFYR